MSYKEFYASYNQLLQEQYPSTQELKPTVSALPICPFVVSLSSDLFQEMQKIVQLLYRLAHSENYKQYLQKHIIKDDNVKTYLKTSVSPSSVLMSYDFHVTPEQKLKLIEVNTHSSGYLVSELVDQTHAMSGLSQTALHSLSDSFQSEWQYFIKLFGQAGSPERVCIVDQQVQQQRMYIEFLMYKDFFRKFLNWSCDVQEAKDLKLDSNSRLRDSQGSVVSMVYSRSTDFYWESREMSAIKKAFLNKKCCVSPHPIEYFLLADKERLCDWSDEMFLDSMGLQEEEKKLIQKVVPKTVPIEFTSAEELWGQRKKWFFKPMRKYGGKLVYRGKNLTKKVFDSILGKDFLCQELVPPAVFTDPGGENWKYDIRAFVYKDQVQKLVARVYQGQLTGFNVPNAGFASILVK